jgi:predicted unusual protein kinase regulating ubiquinone biosynthesis (AarF/ABC1/UbiB family)
MDTNQPTLEELMAALPPEIEGANGEWAPAREDLQGLLAGLAEKPIPTGRMSRLWSLGTLQAKVAAAYLAWWLRSGFKDADAKQRGLDETHVATAVQVLGRMSYMRGAVMKLGQVIAHWPEVAPASFTSVLGRLYSEAPPMHFALVREQARRELGADPTEVFDDFETEAFAAASLGQVHRARLKGSGAPVAVKIQYPDIGRTIHQDLSNLKAASFGMRFTGDWQNLLEQFEGIRGMLEAETDYLREAENLEHARKTLAGLDGVVVPRPIAEFTTQRVLTMEYLDGVTLDPYMASNPPQAERDRHGEHIARASMRMWYSGRMIYADPHPGNYLFLPDGRTGLIDFGCCHRFNDEEYDYVMEVERADRADDRDALIAAMARGCDLDPSDLGPERTAKMLEYCDWTWEPLKEPGHYDFSDPAQFQRGVRLYGDFMKRRWTRSLPVNVWLTKLFFGMRATLTNLKARIPYGEILRGESPLPD